MKIYDSLFGSSEMLCEQVVRHVREGLVEDGPVVAVVDGKGGCWSAAERFSLTGGEEAISTLCGRVADGWEPVRGKIGDWGIVAGELRAGGRHQGYVVIGLADVGESGHEAVLEMLLNQVNTIAELVYKNNQLHHHQLKSMSVIGPHEASVVN